MNSRKIKFGMCFSLEFQRENPLEDIGEKLPVYLRFLDFCSKKGWEVYVLTRKTYKGNGIFSGSWRYEDGKFEKVVDPVRIDIVYDRTGGLKFPPENDELIVVNTRDFKTLCWDKWLQYKEVGKYMAKSYLLKKNEKEKLADILSQIKGDFVVLKPTNGLKGIGIYIGSKKDIQNFEFRKNANYIVQEFIDTSSGIKGIVEGMHDLRVVIVNAKAVWSHVRTPPKGSFEANVAQGGTIKEVDYQKNIPDSIKKIVEAIAKDFYKKYDNPVYSLDFGMSKAKPYLIEINDTIGFPRWEMKKRDNFLTQLVDNIESKL